VAIFYMSFHFVSCKSKPDFPFFSFSFLWFWGHRI
jgi:hypothetical protein